MQETGKQRAIRIPLQYYTKPDRMQHLKLTTTWVVLGLALIWWAWGLAQSDGRFRYSRGPLAGAHAMWEMECTACHVSFVHAGEESWLRSLMGQGESDTRCANCHAGPEHSSREFKGEVPGCAACHRDHRGRDASLTRVTDDYCTRCHANLAEHTDTTKARSASLDVPARDFAQRVTRFVDDHPEFRIVEEHRTQKTPDPGRLKFSHKVHMAIGMGQDATIEYVAKSAQQRYKTTEDGLLRLDCGDCHRLDSGDFDLARDQPGTALPASRGSRLDMLPITFNNQCRDCHQLSFDTEAENSVPHGLQPEEVITWIHGYYGAAGPGSASPPKVQESIDFVFDQNSQCQQCHHYDIQVNARGELAVLNFDAPQVPDVWFKHAIFDHSAHRAMSCKVCHADAYHPDSASREAPIVSGEDISDEIMLPGIEVCQGCHHDRSGGARHDCVECHRYHNRDRPLEGIGGEARRARGGHTFETVTEFRAGPKSDGSK